jgi:hypothetical protein
MADFLAGGEYPIPVQGEDGVGIEFKPFGVNMQFTPTVVDGDIINLALNAEVSSIGPTVATGGGAEIPSLNTRRASTTVELRDGESFAIAGLLAGRLPRHGGPGALAGRSADPRRAVPLGQLPAGTDGACDHHHRPSGEPGPRRGAGASHRPRNDPDARPTCSCTAAPRAVRVTERQQATLQPRTSPGPTAT